MPNKPTESHEPDGTGRQRVQLMEAALQLVQSAGPKAFTLRDVARQAQRTLEQVQAHFATKEDLLLDILEEGVAHFVGISEEAVAHEGSALENLHRLACAYVDFSLRFPGHFAVLFEPPPEILEQRPSEPAQRNAFGVLIRCVERAQEEGSLPEGDPMAFTLPLWAVVHGIARLAMAGLLRMPRKQLLDFTRRASVHMLRGMSHQ